MKKKKFVFPPVIVISCFLLYGNTLHHDYVLDDAFYTNKNEYVLKGFSAFKDIFNKGSFYGYDKTNDSQYRPLTLLNFMAEVSIFGLNPHVSHFINVILFALSSLMLYFFLQKILKKQSPDFPISATLLFIFHPIHTEVVANIKSRDELLGLLFGLASFYLLMLYQERVKIRYYLFSLGAFFISIFCKENCLSFAVVIPLLLYFFSFPDSKKIALKSLPYFILAAAYLFIRSQVLQNNMFMHPIPLINNSLMAAGNSWDSWATRFVLLGKYVYMVIVPYPLSWDYSYNQIPIVSWRNWKTILSVLTFGVMMVGMLLGFRKRSVYSFLIAFFCATLFLSSNFIIKIAWTFAERFLYTPSIGFCIAFPLLMAKMIETRSWVRYIPIACLLILYTVIVVPRNRVWASNFTLYSSGVLSAPNSARTHLFLAREYGEKSNLANDSDEKRKLWKLDIEESYRALAIYRNYTEAYINLGVLYSSSGKNDSARSVFQKALEINPRDAGAANNLGIICEQEARYKEAEKYFLMALKIDSTFPISLVNLGAVYQKTGELDKAAYCYNRELRLNPENEDVRTNFFVMYYNSGLDFFKEKKYDEAFKQFMLAGTYNSRSAEVLGYLGMLYQIKGDFSKAIEYYRKSLEIDPGNEAFKQNLDNLLNPLLQH